MELLIPLLAAVAVAALGFGWLSSSALPARLRTLSIALRGLAVAGLVLLAVNPGEWKSPVEREDSDWVALLDRSASMSTADLNGAQRWAEALQLAQQAVAASDDAKRARVLTFASHLDEDPGSLAAVRDRIKPDGDGTDIPGALSELFARYQARQRRLAGVLLISDGRQQAGRGYEETARLARTLAAPVHTLTLGGPVSCPDISIEPRHALEIGFAGQPVRVTASVRNTHSTPVRPPVRLSDAAGKEIASAAVELAPGASTNVTLTFSPSVGFAEYTWSVQPMPGEAIADNNTARAGVLAFKEPLRVLVVEGVPHWDSKFLIQWFRKQSQFRLTTVHRLAGERFFRIGGETGSEDAQTRDVFPDKAEELDMYDVVVFGQGAEYFLNADRVRLLRRYVSERGGCVLFSRAKPYNGSFPELAEIEPLAWAAPVPADASSSTWRPTPDGEEAGLFGGALPGAQDAIWGRLPRVTPLYFTRELPSFAVVLAAAQGGSADKAPLVASRRFGKGQTAAVNVGDLWRWDFFPTSEEAGPLYRAFWPELVQWLATHGDFLPGQSVSLRLSAPRAAPGEPVQAILQTRGKAAAMKAQPLLRIFTDGSPEEVRPQQAPGRDGWSAVFTPSAPGLLRLEASVEGAPQYGTAVAMLRVRRPPAERDDASADPDTMAALAAASGGGTVTATNLTAVVRSFDAAAPDTTDAPPVWDPAWDHAWLLLLLLGALGFEWFIRRRNGLY